MVRQPTKHRRFCVLTLNTPLFVFIGERDKNPQRLDCGRSIHATHGSAEPRVESFYSPFVAGIDLPHQGVVDSYNLTLYQACNYLSMLVLKFTDGFSRYGISIIKIRRSGDRLFFIMGIPVLVKRDI